MNSIPYQYISAIWPRSCSKNILVQYSLRVGMELANKLLNKVTAWSGPVSGWRSWMELSSSAQRSPLLDIGFSNCTPLGSVLGFSHPADANRLNRIIIGLLLYFTYLLYSTLLNAYNNWFYFDYHIVVFIYMLIYIIIHTYLYRKTTLMWFFLCGKSFAMFEHSLRRVLFQPTNEFITYKASYLLAAFTITNQLLYWTFTVIKAF